MTNNFNVRISDIVINNFKNVVHGELSLINKKSI